MAFIPVNQGGAMAGGLAAQIAQQPAPGVPFTDQAAIDRKRRLAEMLAQNSQRPVDSGLGAASALAQALVGRFKEKKADKLDAQNAEYRRTALAQALAEKDPAMQAMLLARAQDPNLQEFGIKRSFGLQDEARAAEAATANYQRERTDKVADREDAQSFQTDMYGRQESAAERRAREQREFTAQENALNRGSTLDVAQLRAEGDAKRREVTEERGKFNQETKLRGEFDKLTKDHRDTFQMMNTIRASADQKTSQGDLALVVAFTKILDPGSVAREGEVRLTQSAASLMENTRAILPRLEKGQTLLDDATRRKYVQAAEEMFGKYNQAYKVLEGKYAGLAQRQGLDPKNIIIGAFNDPNDLNKPPSAPGAAPPQAIDMLRSDPSPEAMREFDEMFGPGAAQKALGQ